MILFEYRFELPAYPTMRQRVAAKIDRLVERICRPVVVGFARGIITRAREDGVLSSHQIHELHGRIDKRLPHG